MQQRVPQNDKGGVFSELVAYLLVLLNMPYTFVSIVIQVLNLLWYNALLCGKRRGFKRRIGGVKAAQAL